MFNEIKSCTGTKKDFQKKKCWKVYTCVLKSTNLNFAKNNVSNFY